MIFTPPKISSSNLKMMLCFGSDDFPLPGGLYSQGFHVSVFRGVSNDSRCLCLIILVKLGGILWVWPPPSNRDYQDYSPGTTDGFSKERTIATKMQG